MEQVDIQPEKNNIEENKIAEVEKNLQILDTERNNLVEDDKKDMKKGIDDDLLKPVSFWLIQYYKASCSVIVVMIFGTIGALGMATSMPLLSVLFGDAMNNLGATRSTEAYMEGVVSMVLKFVYVGIGLQFVGWLMFTCFSYSGKIVILNIKKDYFHNLLRQEQLFFDKRNPFEFATKVQSQTVLMEKGVNI